MLRQPHTPRSIDLRKQLGLFDGQMRGTQIYKNKWWSFDNAETAFGYGDLDMADLERILAWVKTQPEPHVFTGWNEHHGSDWQQMDEPQILISAEDGIRFPFNEMMEVRRQARK